MKRSLVACTSALILLAAGTALAHHSPILFDRTKKVTLAGTVAEFAWTNPHASIQLDVAKPGGAPERWGVEMNSPNNLVKDGWKSTTSGPRISSPREPSASNRYLRMFPFDEVAGSLSFRFGRHSTSVISVSSIRFHL